MTPMKQKSAYKNLRVSYITNTVTLLHVHVLATLVAILSEMSTRDILQKLQERIQM
jgi:hypothetical protein